MRSRESQRRLWAGSTEAALQAYVYDILKIGSSRVRRDVGIDHDLTIDFIVERIRLDTERTGGLRTIGVEVRLSIGTYLAAETISDIAEILFKQYHAQEFWVISPDIDPDIAKEFSQIENLKLFTPDELARALGMPHTEAPPTRSRRTKAAKAVIANGNQIILSAATLDSLIESRMASLSAAPPNSTEARVVWQGELSQLENLKREVAELRREVEEYLSGGGKDKKLTVTVESFDKGLADWWDKNHIAICNSTYAASVFCLAVTVCSMVGAGGNMAVAISGMLAGGKTVTDGLRALRGKSYR